ncbi:hypothetical protein ABWK22_01925 [Gottfriedia acidiceleris]|uniref:hypothetical protein n=1 Tax=Gottfriedia acidiceleris TaxID=371036 RepID=UPI003394A8B2
MFEYEDFYHEPTEFELQIEALKASLLKSVQEKYVTEMEQLRKENADLQDIKRNFAQIQSEFRNKEMQLERERNDLVRKVRSEKLGELMKDFEVITYRACQKRQTLPKCDKCNQRRQIEYTTPLGNTAHENCDCNKGVYIYVPEEHVATEFKKSRNKVNEMTVWYKKKQDYDEDYYVYDPSTMLKVIYHEGLKFEDLSSHDTFFKTKEECQAFCDYLNAKPKDKE